jgi:hypothetical protein
MDESRAGPESAQRGRQAASEAGGAVAEHAGAVAHEAKRQATDLAHEAQEAFHHRADEQTHRAAGVLQDFSRQLRGMTEEGRPPQGRMVDLAHEGAERIEHLADRLDRDGWDGAMADLSRFARRRPGTFLAAAFGIGLMAGRVVRNADTDRLRSEMGGDGQDRGGPRPGGSPRVGVADTGGRFGEPLGTTTAPLPSEAGTPPLRAEPLP